MARCCSSSTVDCATDAASAQEARVSSGDSNSSPPDSTRQQQRDSQAPLQEGRHRGGDSGQEDRAKDSARGWVNSGAGRLGASRLGALQKNPAAAVASQTPGLPVPRRGVDAAGSMDPHRDRQRDLRPPRREMQRDRDLRTRKSDPELSEFNRRFSGFFTHAHTKERSREWHTGASTANFSCTAMPTLLLTVLLRESGQSPMANAFCCLVQARECQQDITDSGSLRQA